MNTAIMVGILRTELTDAKRLLKSGEPQAAYRCVCRALDALGPLPAAVIECKHCGAGNSAGFSSCYRCGLWPNIDYTKPIDHPDRVIKE